MTRQRSDPHVIPKCGAYMSSYIVRNVSMTGGVISNDEVILEFNPAKKNKARIRTRTLLRLTKEANHHTITSFFVKFAPRDLFKPTTAAVGPRLRHPLRRIRRKFYSAPTSPASAF